MKSKTPDNQDPVYMGPESGPFRCGNCEYFREPRYCNKTEMIKHAAKVETGLAIVAANGCCNYFEPKD
jgi:hypothetical protein